MPRRKPVSGKQRKEELQIKRAIKRGDVPPESTISSRGSRPSGRGRGGGSRRGKVFERANVDASRRLESSFVKFSPEFLEETKRKASSLTIDRPIPIDKLLLPVCTEQRNNAKIESSNLELTLPRRPKWRYDMSKKEVESNETAYFKRWLDNTDSVVRTWRTDLSASNNPKQPEQLEKSGVLNPDTQSNAVASERMPYASPLFERNLEVWRQFWRVVEICQVLLVLLDSRCPSLHYPPSLHAYLSTFRPARKVIFVLTKVDIVGQRTADLWKDYLRREYPNIRVVTVESYIKKTSGEGQGKRVTKEPHIPADLRKDLVQALQEAHDELCLPPPHVASDADRLAKWKPTIVPKINWDMVLNAQDSDISYDWPIRSPDADVEDISNGEAGTVEDFLSVGLIGQPNVGKSSLLNALFGGHKVKASKTPGKTKHFQTLFWSKQVRLVDCPGLVFPGFVDLEMQVLTGILPISQIPAIPSSIYHALQYLSLETILALQHPAEKEDAVKSKRTWRAGMQAAKTGTGSKTWTATDVLTAFAEKNGWITAKAGRPDVNRAGNYILRALAEGRIKWAFYPPDTDLSAHAQRYKGLGIWIEGEVDAAADHADSDYADDDDDDHSVTASEEGDETVSDDEYGESPDQQLQAGIATGSGMFSALTLEDDDDRSP